MGQIRSQKKDKMVFAILHFEVSQYVLNIFYLTYLTYLSTCLASSLFGIFAAFSFWVKTLKTFHFFPLLQPAIQSIKHLSRIQIAAADSHQQQHQQQAPWAILCRCEQKRERE